MDKINVNGRTYFEESYFNNLIEEKETYEKAKKLLIVTMKYVFPLDEDLDSVINGIEEILDADDMKEHPWGHTSTEIKNLFRTYYYRKGEDIKTRAWYENEIRQLNRKLKGANAQITKITKQSINKTVFNKSFFIALKKLKSVLDLYDFEELEQLEQKGE